MAIHSLLVFHSPTADVSHWSTADVSHWSTADVSHWSIADVIHWSTADFVPVDRRTIIKYVVQLSIKYAVQLSYHKTAWSCSDQGRVAISNVFNIMLFLTETPKHYYQNVKYERIRPSTAIHWVRVKLDTVGSKFVTSEIRIFESEFPRKF